MRANAAAPAFVFVLLMTIPCVASAAPPADLPADPRVVPISEVLRDTQRSSEDTSTLDLVWWIPVEFWQAAMADRPPQEVRAIVAALSPYTLVGVAYGTVSSLGLSSWTGEEDLRAALVLRDGLAEFRPLSESAINADARDLAGVVKPILAGLMGGFGENLHFFFFAGREAGRRVDDPFAGTALTVTHGSETYVFRRPLGSLLAPKTCRVDHERLSGAYRYCPYHGKELVRLETGRE